MNCLDPLPHLRLAKMLPDTPLQCPACKQKFKAIEGFAFLTYWHAEDEYGGRGRALSILKQLAKLKAGDFVFAGHTRGKSASNMAMAMMLRRMNVGNATVHGFRSSFRDWAGNVSSFPREVTETAWLTLSAIRQSKPIVGATRWRNAGSLWMHGLTIVSQKHRQVWYTSAKQYDLCEHFHRQFVNWPMLERMPTRLCLCKSHREYCF